ncbi:glycoside hydrolase family 5 protein [Phlebiopsis gigantea 11061_1 CR5-6]|uniref:Glycoside hydrolase family 5 protein n=1 Tax=Phlebiopsis gigantea (strain 11061_1 CR5-6) TaxID=745531 RepID=A0A0C3S8H8_PHLG1|nr:glycoside hydrolase family 5 protein [Phlebiopsis gigantea 11061_1 CR5-6]
MVLAGMPDKIYGTNLGSWLVLEAWMLPAEWAAMGGQSCDDCSQCIASEFAFAQAYPDTVDQIFAKHWETWFNQDDVDQLVAAGINTVRIPLGYWLVESLVNRQTEFFPRGGLKQLQRGLSQLKAAGIQAILDHHALPGVQTAGQQFTGRCTSDVEFYTEYNYHRALVWTAVMTTLAHLDPNFGSVFSIEAVNEPIMDASQTPGYGGFQQNFVKVVRAVELILGIPVPGAQLTIKPSTSNFTSAITAVTTSTNLTSIFNDEVTSALQDAVPILVQVGYQLAVPAIFNFNLASAPLHSQREPLVTNFMDVNWQYNSPANPADAAIGPQGYDNHLYYSFGGVADANPDAYLTSICNLDRVQADAALGDSPLWFGEWGLPTQFNATDEFLFQWADAQKLAYSQGAGWIFWNFKVEISEAAGDLARQWSYFEGLKLGYLTQDPSQVHDSHVCDPYKANSTGSAQ